MSTQQLRPAFIRDTDMVDKDRLTDAERTAIAKQTPPENKRYVILVRADPGYDEDYRWIECFGRTEAYEEGKRLTMSGYVDINGTSIMVEGGQGLENALSLKKFMQFMYWNYYRADESWDIHDFIQDADDGGSNEDTSANIGENFSGIDQGAMMFSENETEETNV